MFCYFLYLNVLNTAIALNFNLEEMVHKDDHILRNIGRGVYISDVLPSERKYQLNDKYSNQTHMNNHKNISEMEFENMVDLDDSFDQYAEHLKNKGVEQLIELGKSIEKDLGLAHNSINIVVNAIVKIFKRKYKEHVNGIALTEDFGDKDSLLPILIQTTNKIIFKAKKKLISIIGEKYTGKTQILYNILLKIRKEKSYADKQEFENLCEKHRICINVISFSDYMVDVISEIEKFEDRELKELFAQVRNQVADKSDFFKSLLHNDTIQLITAKIRKLSNDVEGTRLLLLVIRSVMRQRRKPIRNRNPEVIKRTNAVRDLLKIIDKAYGYEDDDELEKIFELLIKKVSHYRVSLRDGFKNTLSMFINHMVGIFADNIDTTTKDKIKNITKIIILGNVKDTSLRHLN